MFWSRRSDSEQPFSLEGRRLISLTAWGRAWDGGGLTRYMGPWCISLCSWRGPHLVLWLILASWLPSSLQSTQWVGSGDRQAGSVVEEAIRGNASSGHAQSQFPGTASRAPGVEGPKVQAWSSFPLICPVT